jgi:uncharacterized protein (TIGR02145 family)
MKKIFTLIIAALITLIAFTQAPQKMSYQCVVRNASGELVKGSSVGMKISILKEDIPVYVETQTPTTNANGLVTIEIGGGIIVTGTFEAIDWSSGNYYIKTETDPTGDTNYTITGTSQLLSVPYAFYAATSEKANELEIKMQKLSNTVMAGGIVTDIDGISYNTVKIGTQTWMAENLKTTKYNNGDLIPSSYRGMEIQNEITPKYAWVWGYHEAFAATRGRLYTWYAVTDIRAVCPTGWHVPDDSEWKTLEIYLGMTQEQADSAGRRGTDQGVQLKSTTSWNILYHSGINGTNISGFTALPYGHITDSGSSEGSGMEAYWWSSTEDNAKCNSAWCRMLWYSSKKVERNTKSKVDGLSVRCLKD